MGAANDSAERRMLGDPLGRAMWDYHQGRAGKLVYRDGADVQDGNVASLYFTPREEWSDRMVSDLERLSDPGGPVLDVGCGTGQHVRWFQDQGVDGVGVDVSPNAVATARDRGVDQVIVGDMRDLPFEGDRFRALHCVGTQLGLGGSLAGMAELLREFARVTSDDAVALVDNYDPTRVGDDFFGYRPDPRDGIAHRCFHFEYERAEWAPGVHAVGRSLHFLLCSPDRLESALAETPWTAVGVRYTNPRRSHYRTALAKAGG